MTLQPNTWNKGLLFIKDQIDKIAGLEFNSVLMNWYRDGEDYINWHTDAEKIEMPLKHGTFLLMRGQTQHFWQHGVPKEKKIKEARFNLTFRVINH